MDRAGVAPAVFLRHGFTDRCLRYSAHLSITAPDGFEPSPPESESGVLPLDEKAIAFTAGFEPAVHLRTPV